MPVTLDRSGTSWQILHIVFTNNEWSLTLDDHNIDLRELNINSTYERLSKKQIDRNCKLCKSSENLQWSIHEVYGSIFVFVKTFLEIDRPIESLRKRCLECFSII